MRNRKTHKRICSGCSKEELVRSDQINKQCPACSTNTSGLRRYHREHPEACGNASRKHGLHGHRIYRIYKSMLERCGHTSVVHKFACYYADRGIRVCDEWLNDRTAFFDWAFANGYSDDLQIDREENDLGYSPDNCRWVTPKENQDNRRDRSGH